MPQRLLSSLIAFLIFAGAAEAYMTLQLLPAIYGGLCLDGSRGGYYYKAGTGSGVGKWVIFVEGGGWCYKLSDCAARANSSRGSSTFWAAKATSVAGVLQENMTTNPDFYNWNLVYLKYCDGASFTGNREEPVEYNESSSEQTTTVYFRGYRIFRGAINHLISTHGLGNASEVLFGGASAGGLSSYLHADQLHDMLPTTAKFGVLAVSGFFLWQSNVKGEHVYEQQMRNVYQLQSSYTGLPGNCTRTKSAANAWQCYFAQEAFKTISSHFFVMNSKYDSWGTSCILGAEPVSEDSDSNGNCSAIPSWASCTSLGRCNLTQLALVNGQWAVNLTNTLQSVPTYSNVGNGVFLSSCFQHTSEGTTVGWNKYQINGVTPRQAVGLWWASGFTDPSSSHSYIDCYYSKANNKCCNPTCCA